MINETENRETLKTRILYILKKNHDKQAKDFYYIIKQSFPKVSTTVISEILQELIDEYEAENVRPN